MRKTFAALAVLLSLSLPSAFAQTPPATTVPAVEDKIAVPIWPTTAVALPDIQPTEASFSLGRIEGIAPELLSGVTAKGYARKVPVENQSIGQILVVSVAKNGREETISTEGLTAQFDAKETSQLFPEKTVEVQGSKTALVAALQRLASPTTKEEKPAAKDDVSQNPTSSGGSSNDLAAGYKSPTVSAAPAADTPEPVVDYRTTKEGCPVRIDTVQGVAVQQSKVQTFTDGALTSDGECSDSNASFVLKKSYLSCPTDVVDLNAMKAWPKYSLYYIDDAGENHPIGECVQDAETVYTISEDEAQCPIFLDFGDGKAVPQSALVYLNRNNSLVQARSCEDSTKTAALPMTQNVANCPLRHDYTGGRSYELSMWTYVRDGVTYQAAPCADTGRSFPHDTVYADLGGNYVCTPITNLTNRTVTLQSRKRITVDGVPQYITECTPDTSSQGIFATTDGCMDPSKWTHDLVASISYGQERYWYAKADGSREYVTLCQTSSTSYPHSHTITGYQAHDDQLWAYPLTTVKITVNGSPYTIASSQVLPGAPQIAYALSEIVDIPSGQSRYEDCAAYRETARAEKWARPDGTEYSKIIGAGSSVGPVDVCVSTVIDSRTMQTGWGKAGGCGTVTFYTWYQTVNKLQKKNSESGTVVATTCGFANNSWQGWSSSSGGWDCSGAPDGQFQTLYIPPCPF